MLAQKVFVNERVGRGCGLGVNLHCEIGELGDGFENHSVLRGFSGSHTPGKRGVVCDQHGGHLVGVDILEQAGDGMSGFFFVFYGDVSVIYNVGHLNCAAEIIGVRGAETGDGLACLSPRSCVLGVGVADATDFRKSLIKNDVSCQIRGRAKMSFDDFAMQIGHHQIFGLHRFVRDAAGLNNQEGIFAGNAAGVAKGVQDQSATNQLNSFKNFAQFGRSISPSQVTELCLKVTARRAWRRYENGFFCQCMR